MNVVLLDEQVLHELSVSDEQIYAVALDEDNFITILDDDIMEVTLDDGVCC